MAYFIFNYTVKKVTERITKEQIGRITGQEERRITESEIDRITQETIKQKTEEITNQILDGRSAGKLKEVECDKTQTKRQFDSSQYYEGALIDAHLHIPFTFEAPKALYQQADWPAPTLEVEVAAGDIICGFDKEKISSAFGFYVVPNLLKGSALQPIKQVDFEYNGRIIPFLMPAHISGLDLKPSEAEEILNSNKGLFKGYGEIAFYKGSFKGISPDDPSMLEIYRIADQNGLVVMIHPDYDQQAAIENILKLNPNVKFLFHGHEIESSLMAILDKYPNAYYTIDTSLFGIQGEHTVATLYGVEDKKELISELTDNFNEILETNLVIWKPRIEKHPDKFLWGTDRAFDWHFDQDTGALLEEISRSFIGQLSPEIQEKFAYKNAEKLFEER
ncbi:amidohydrolase family protein [Candidatus Woesearchaeota archaeon]|nr:amidohydrolase family protein [Candidatus Woesearchaeota archaeon]